MTWTDPDERLPEPGVAVEILTTQDTIISATYEEYRWRVGGKGRTVIYIVNVAKWRERPCESNAIKSPGGGGDEVDSLLGE